MYNAVLNYMSRIRTNDMLKRLAALSATANALGGGCYMKRGQLFRLYPNLFIIVIAHPGNGKSMISNVVEGITDHYNDIHSGMPELQACVATKKVNPAAFVQYLTKYGIREYAGEQYTPVLISSTELSVLVANVKHGNLLEDFLDMYDCPAKFSKFTKTDGFEIIPRIVPTILGATTPDFWKNFMPTNLANDGFTSRTLLYYFDEFIEREGDIQWGTDDELRDCVQEMVRLRNLHGQFAWSAKGQEWFKEVFTPKNNELMRHHFRGSDLWQGYVNRRSDQMLKIAMCLSAAKGNDLLITPENGEAAVWHLKQIEQNMNGLIKPRNMKPDGASRDDILHIFGDTPKTESEILHALSQSHRFITLDDLVKMLRTLLAEGILEQVGNTFRKRK
jgi:hypothetical protein